jgi:hypothetical protein
MARILRQNVGENDPRAIVLAYRFALLLITLSTT